MGSEPGIEEEIDRLYQIPLTDFVASRNALAQSLKKRGDAGSARRVKELQKPSPSAWAVNQLYWSSPSRLQAVIDAGDAHRRAQRDVLSGAGSLGEGERNERTAIDEAERHAIALLRAKGQEATAALVRRIRTTLEALAAWGSDNPRPVDGRLVSDLQAPGFAALASLGPIARVEASAARTAPPAAPPSADPRPTPAAEASRPKGREDEKERERREREEREERERRAKALEALERELDGARTALTEAEALSEETTVALRAARERWVAAEAASKRADEERDRRRARVAEAEAAVEAARRSKEERSR